MAIVYFDASALVKLLVEESGSDIAAALWDGCDAAVSSRMAYPEVCAALAAAGRNHDLDEHSLASCERHWEDLWAAMRPVGFTPAVERSAGRLAKRHGLRGRRCGPPCQRPGDRCCRCDHGRMGSPPPRRCRSREPERGAIVAATRIGQRQLGEEDPRRPMAGTRAQRPAGL